MPSHLQDYNPYLQDQISSFIDRIRTGDFLDAVNDRPSIVSWLDHYDPNISRGPGSIDRGLRWHLAGTHPFWAYENYQTQTIWGRLFASYFVGRITYQQLMDYLKGVTDIPKPPSKFLKHCPILNGVRNSKLKVGTNV